MLRFGIITAYLGQMDVAASHLLLFSQIPSIVTDSDKSRPRPSWYYGVSARSLPSLIVAVLYLHFNQSGVDEEERNWWW